MGHKKTIYVIFEKIISNRKLLNGVLLALTKFILDITWAQPKYFLSCKKVFTLTVTYKIVINHIEYTVKYECTKLRYRGSLIHLGA